MGICAYCEEDKGLTREHIIPDFIYKLEKGNGPLVGWNEKAKKIVGGEGKIKDVCADCNNVKLGTLDGYAKIMLQNSGVLTQNYLSKIINLEYDYDLFKRWILKVSFNSARSSNNNPKSFKKFVPYILGNEKSCDDVVIVAGLYKPEILSAEEILKYKGKFEIGPNGEFNPFHARLAWMPQVDTDFKVRVIVVGALLIHIVMFKSNLQAGYKRAKLRQWLKLNPLMVEISPKRKALTVHQLDMTFIDTQEVQHLRMEALGAI